MVILPVECLRQVLSYLDLATLKNARQACRLFGTIGEETLISSIFTTYPHRRDLERLESLSGHEEFRIKVKELVFVHGEVNEYHARHNTHFIKFMREPEERIRSVEEVGRWCVEGLKRIDLSNCCEPTRLGRIFSRLTRLTALSITLMTCPFPLNDQDQDQNLEALREIWSLPTTRLLPRVASTERFTDTLTALSNQSSIHLTRLSHDRLPFEFFGTLKKTFQDQFTPIFAGLKRLALGIDYSDMPNNLHTIRGFEALSHILRTAKGLESLKLVLYGRKKLDITPLLTSFSENGFVFENLTDINLQAFSTSEDSLATFLIAQKSLKTVQFGGPGLKAPHQKASGGVRLNSGSFNGLFDRLDREMELERCWVQGDLVGMESGERWVLDDVEEMGNLREYVID